MALVQNQTCGPVKLGGRPKFKSTQLQAPNIFYLKKKFSGYEGPKEWVIWTSLGGQSREGIMGKGNSPS